MVRAGRDTDFNRGENAYERYMADPTVKPNPSLGVIERAPFYAVEIFPGDLGTCGGLVTNERAQVMRADDGRAVPGLYAAGNVTAPMAGGEYWGAGASIGASMTFGYIAARDCAR
jgi:3-oxosteroid 1-dehydrogenase